MAHYALFTIITILFSCAPLSSWAQEFFLYSPQPVTGKQLPPLQDGIIVQEIFVKKGDTLHDISRKFCGNGMYFPQILLFNSIRNPNLIYPGNRLKVPINHHSGNTQGADSKSLDKLQKANATGAKNLRQEMKPVTPARQTNAALQLQPQNTDISLGELRTPETVKRVKSRHKKKTAPPPSKIAVSESPVVMPLSAPLPASYARQASPGRTADAVTGQKLFEAAVKFYRVDDCRTALELLDRYLANNSDSPLAADANLYKAECYLKLSSQ